MHRDAGGARLPDTPTFPPTRSTHKSKTCFELGHTDLNNSVANVTIASELARIAPGIGQDILAERYPDGRIDADAERARMEAADIIIVQYPLFWFGQPSLLQRWQEQVFVHGWSHGSTGNALRGKKLLLGITTGAPEAAYTVKDGQGHSLDEYALPWKVTCGFTGMEYAGLVATYGVSYLLRGDPEKVEAVRSLARAHAERLVARVKELSARAA